MYKIADIFFFCFHIALILFNLFGWLWKPLRKWNLATLGLTAFSWFVLGIFYGFGYCFLTDWHWQIREALGYDITSNSYIHFLVTTIFHITTPESTVDVVTAIAFFAACVASIVVNVRDFRKKKGRNRPANQK